MGSLAVPHSFKRDAPASGTDVNENFDEVEAQVNDIDDDNIGDGNISEVKITHDTSGGHTHDGSDSAAPALATKNHATLRGAMIFKNGTVSIAEAASATITFTGEAFTELPLIMVYKSTGGSYVTTGFGNWLNVLVYSAYDIATDAFKIENLSSSDDPNTFYWVAIGI